MGRFEALITKFAYHIAQCQLEIEKSGKSIKQTAIKREVRKMSITHQTAIDGNALALTLTRRVGPLQSLRPGQVHEMKFCILKNDQIRKNT